MRALVAAIVIVAALACAALYVARNAGLGSSHELQPFHIAQSGFSDLFGDGPNDDSAVGVALIQLESNYYKPIDPQTPFHGVATALRDYLKSKHVSATLPAEHATGVASVDASHLEDEVAYAQSHYGALAGYTAGGTHVDGNTALLEDALTGMMNSVNDPYTVYLSPREIRQLTEALRGGDFGGIGIYIFPLRNNDILVQPIDGMPANRAGMKTPLILDSVNGTRVHGISSDAVQDLIRGPAGTTVTIRAHPIGKPAAVRTYPIVREIIHVPTVSAKIENGIDYIRLSEFGETSAREIHAALLDGKARGAKGYILDLRFNGGGLVDSAVDIVSDFVPTGQVVVSEVDRQGDVAPQYASGGMIAGLSPLVILVNKYTASASEITAGALQDYHRATLVGTQTFGKGVVQSIYPIPSGQGALKITIARYVTPHGRDIQHRGIRPDIIVEQSPDPRLVDTPADKQLITAKARIRQLLAPAPRS